MKAILNRIYKGDKESFFQSFIKEKGKLVVTVNPEIIMQSYQNEKAKEILFSPKTLLCADGESVVYACKQLGVTINGKIAGVELVGMLIDYCIKNDKKIGIYGASEEVITLFSKKHPNLKGYFFHGYQEFSEVISEKLKECDFVLLALGVPKQEFLGYSLLNKGFNGVIIGVGGSIDVLSGSKKRAPKIMIKLKLEWLYRLLKEPKRIKRFYKNNVLFMKEIKKSKRNDK